MADRKSTRDSLAPYLAKMEGEVWSELTFPQQQSYERIANNAIDFFIREGVIHHFR